MPPPLWKRILTTLPALKLLASGALAKIRNGTSLAVFQSASRPNPASGARREPMRNQHARFLATLLSPGFLTSGALAKFCNGANLAVFQSASRPESGILRAPEGYAATARGIENCAAMARDPCAEMSNGLRAHGMSAMQIGCSVKALRA